MKEKDMEHHWFEDRLSAWLDQGLPVMEQSAMDDHVASCSECQAQAERFRSLDHLVKRHAGLRQDHPFFDDLASRTNERIFGVAEKSEQKKTAITPISWWRWTAVAAGLILTSVVSWKVFEEQPKVRQLSAPAEESTPEKDIPLSDSVMLPLKNASNQESENPVSEGRLADSQPSKSFETKLSAPMPAVQTPVATGISESKIEKPSPSLPQVEISNSEGAKKSEVAADNAAIEKSAAVSADSASLSEATSLAGKSNEPLYESTSEVASSARRAIDSSLSKVLSADVAKQKASRSSYAAPKMSAQAIDTSAVANIRRLIQLYKSETDTTLIRVYQDSLRSALVQHPTLPADLTQQLDSLGFSR